MAKAKAVGGVVDTSTRVPVVRALDNINFHLKEGDRLGLIGANGAGKTTLIRVLADIYTPTSGEVTRQGSLVPMFDINIGFDGESTGYENIFMRGIMAGRSKKSIADSMEEIAEFSGLGEYLDLPIRTYSSGMLLRLMFSIATNVSGNIVLMDEWIAVGDADFREKANVRLRQITANAGILVLASHDLGILRQLCNLGMRLESGKVKSFGPIEQVLAEKKQVVAEKK